jgi:hypothetical protein
MHVIATGYPPVARIWKTSRLEMLLDLLRTPCESLDTVPLAHNYNLIITFENEDHEKTLEHSL